MEECLFCKIVRGEIPSKKIYEDDNSFAFLDINPANPGHALVIPKTHAENIFDVEEEDLKNTMASVKKVTIMIKEKLGIEAISQP